MFLFLQRYISFLNWEYRGIIHVRGLSKYFIIRGDVWFVALQCNTLITLLNVLGDNLRIIHDKYWFNSNWSFHSLLETERERKAMKQSFLLFIEEGTIKCWNLLKYEKNFLLLSETEEKSNNTFQYFWLLYKGHL